MRTKAEMDLFDLHTSSFDYINAVLRASTDLDKKLQLIQLACEAEQNHLDVFLGAKDASDDDAKFVKWCDTCEEEYPIESQVCTKCDSFLQVGIAKPHPKPKFTLYKTMFKKRR